MAPRTPPDLQAMNLAMSKRWCSWTLSCTHHRHQSHCLRGVGSTAGGPAATAACTCIKHMQEAHVGMHASWGPLHRSVRDRSVGRLA